MSSGSEIGTVLLPKYQAPFRNLVLAEPASSTNTETLCTMVSKRSLSKRGNLLEMYRSSIHFLVKIDIVFFIDFSSEPVIAV